MITEQIHSKQFITLEKDFLRWLQALGYSPSTVQTRKRNIREFLLYLERSGITSVEKITAYKAGRFVRYLKRRQNKLHGAGLSSATINVGVSSVNKFFEYLRQSGTAGSFTLDNLSYLEENYHPRGILTRGDITSLYDATYYQGHFTRSEPRALQRAISQRDRAMLGIYYGCGLRRSEGTGLDVSDVLTQRGLILVRKGKGSKERYVPVSLRSREHITEYLLVGRPFLVSTSSFSTEGFFVNQFGGRCSDQALTHSLHKLVKRSGSVSLQEKRPSLHTLRHSIATHLMQSGMQIEMIQQFLGHESLESTQIYTHLDNEF
ncbi:tyrosine-type recombinase/integrase [Candidatus Poribacteria bacterium]|nr:tyrosine-type recombinase/integrase [Candidatus Poribacteria bacterium]